MCKKYFFRTTYINYSRVIFQGKSLLSLVPGGISWRVSCLGVVVKGGIIQGKMFEGQRSRRQLPCREFHRGNCPGGDYLGVTVWRAKVRVGIDLSGG